MSILGAIIVPHPPIIFPEVGRGRQQDIQATIDAYHQAAQQVARWQPETLIIISPHATAYSDYFHLSPGAEASGSMSPFGAPQVKLQARYDTALAAEISRQAQSQGLAAGTQGQREAALDHGTMIPLRFLQGADLDCPIIRLGISGLSPQTHYRLGQCLTAAAHTLKRRVAIIASGDLSHKLTADGPYGFAPQGPQFDQQVTLAMASSDFSAFLRFEDGFLNAAAECGLRAFQIMAGALDGLALDAHLLSYEGPFGVGYAVATFTPTGPNPSRSFLRIIAEPIPAQAACDPYVQLARLSLETYVRTGRSAALPASLPAAMTETQAGAFVSLHKHGQLRGCIGTIAPTTDSVAEEILQNAISAGTRDPRFPAVEPCELSQLEYSVDVLQPPEDIASPDELDVRQYGVIVTAGYRRGLLLPNLDGVDTVEQQIAIAKQKAGIAPHENCHLQRFQVVRHQ